MTDAQLQARLRHSKFDGAAGARPKKLLSHVLKLASLMEKSECADEFEATYNKFLSDMTLYEFNMGRIQVCAEPPASKSGLSILFRRWLLVSLCAPLVSICLTRLPRDPRSSFLHCAR